MYLEKVLEQHVWIEAETGDEIDPIERRLEKGRDSRGHDEPDEDLEGEPDVAHQLHVEERLVGERLRLVQGPVGGVEVVGLQYLHEIWSQMDVAHLHCIVITD